MSFANIWQNNKLLYVITPLAGHFLFYLPPLLFYLSASSTWKCPILPESNMTHSLFFFFPLFPVTQGRWWKSLKHYANSEVQIWSKFSILPFGLCKPMPSSTFDNLLQQLMSSKAQALFCYTNYYGHSTNLLAKVSICTVELSRYLSVSA